MTIERCESADHPGWLLLRRALWPDCEEVVHQREIAEMAAEPLRFAAFVAVALPGQYLGWIEVALRSDHVNGTKSSPVAFVEGVYVLPEFRRQGVARMLFAAAEGWAFGCGCGELASDALMENPESHVLHEAMGFEETERVVFFRKEIR